MEKDGRSDRRRRRAERLRREAANCLGIAVGTRDTGTAAVMIDEAERLVGGARALETA